VDPRCQQELRTQGVLDVPAGNNPEDSSQVNVEAMQWVFLYLSIVSMSHSTAKMRGSSTVPSESKCCRTRVDFNISFCLDVWNLCAEACNVLKKYENLCESREHIPV
jgi:hypothetical protein